MINLDKSWAKLPHADYAKTLEGQVIKAIKDGRKKASKVGDPALVTICQKAISATTLLAKLMRDSSAVRVVADYEPNILVDFTNAERFRLSGVEVTDAHQWPVRAKTFSETISLAWKQINV